MGIDEQAVYEPLNPKLSYRKHLTKRNVTNLSILLLIRSFPAKNQPWKLTREAGAKKNRTARERRETKT